MYGNALEPRYKVYVNIPTNNDIATTMALSYFMRQVARAVEINFYTDERYDNMVDYRPYLILHFFDEGEELVYSSLVSVSQVEI